MKIVVLGKVWKTSFGLRLEFYIDSKDGYYWKSNNIALAKCNKRFNLPKLFIGFVNKLDFYKHHYFKNSKGREGFMWQREFEMEEKIMNMMFEKKVVESMNARD